MSTADFYVIAIVIYIISLISAVCLIFIAHKKFQDQNFLLGIFLSSILNLITILSPLWFYFFFVIYIFGFIFGILAGSTNLNIKQGVTSGALGILLSWIFYGVLNFIYLVDVFSGIGLVTYILPAILCGAVGGGLGSKIRLVRGDKVKRVIPIDQKKSKAKN